MMNLILAVDLKNGLGRDNKLAWNIPEELNIFKEKTTNSIVIVGRKTLEQLPKLKDRTIFCISRGINVKCKCDVIHIHQDIEDAVREAKHLAKISGQKIYIIGGNQIYNYFLKNYKNELIVHISIIHNEYVCDTFFNKDNLKDFYITEKTCYDLFTHYEMVYRKYGERQYLDLIKDLIENGERRKSRNAETVSDFCKHLKFDLRDGFPLLTTKKMFTKGIVEELLFFIRGDTNTKTLEQKGIYIWKGNTCREFLDSNGFEGRKEGEMGPMYGSIWRNFNNLSGEEEKEILKESRRLEINYKSYNKDNMSYSTDRVKSIDFGIDQLKNVIEEIKTNPNSRRLLLTTYNPAQVRYGVLYPCHSITIQFYVQDGFLDMFCYNRSSDVALGLPFNIASSSLLLMIIAKLTNLVPRYFNLTLGDAHLYSNHIEGVLEQIERIPYVFPIIKLPEFETLEEVEKLSCESFKVQNYNYYPTIKMEMTA
jgi:dihydrofolate reductase/thymidylate synthase